jgi:hypothetical protein
VFRGVGVNDNFGSSSSNLFYIDNLATATSLSTDVNDIGGNFLPNQGTGFDNFIDKE